MIISELFVLFIFYSFLGWVWETIYCTVQTGHFQNRGFLFGPVCPIYGVSILLVQLLCRYGRGFLNARPKDKNKFISFRIMESPVQ